jgi:hypothetical protein
LCIYNPNIQLLYRPIPFAWGVGEWKIRATPSQPHFHQSSSLIVQTDTGAAGRLIELA